MREWQTVTVAFSASSSEASGRPTRSLRPTTTASAPSSGVLARPQQLHHARRRGRHERRPPLRQQTRRWSGVRPSTSLSGIDRARSSRRRRVWSGSGSCSDDAVHLGGRRSARASSVEQLVRPSSSPAARGRSSGCPPPRRPCACRRRRSATPRRRRPAPSRGPGAVAVLARRAARRRPSPPRARRRATCLPSMIIALAIGNYFLLKGA